MKFQAIKSSILFPALLLAVCGLHAQSYPFLRYSISEGLPQSQVFAAFPDTWGYMWFGTQGGGLCRFDGVKFDAFSTEDGLPSNYVNSITEDASHRLWAGTNQGVCRFDGRQFQVVPGYTGVVNALYAGKDNLIWIGTDKGIYLFDIQKNIMRKYSRVPELGDEAIFTFYPSALGLWVGTNQGAWLLGEQIVCLSAKNGLPANLVRAFARDRYKRLWVATFGGIAIVEETKLKVVSVQSNVLLERAQCLLTDPEGKIWVGTQSNGLSIWSPGDSSWTHLSEQQGLPHNNVRALSPDNAGNVWAATSGGGLARFVSQNFQHFDRSDGLSGDRVYALLEDHLGRLWISVSQNGLQTLDSTGIHAFTRDSGYLNVKCKGLAEDRFGRLWVGTEGKGIAIFDSFRMLILRRNNGLPGDGIQKILRDPAGDMWVATLENGIAKISYGNNGTFSFKYFGTRDGLPEMTISTLLADPQGNIWFATLSGKIGYIKNGKVEAVFDDRHGLPPVQVRCLAFDKRGNIWAGTKGEGVFYAKIDPKNTRFAPAYAPKRLTSKNIYLLQFDLTGKLWAGSENGVDKISFDASGAVSTVDHFGKNEGFLGIETCQDAAIGDRSGNLWFGTMNGLTKYVPSNRTISNHAPNLHFVGISLFYKPLSETTYARWAAADGGLLDGLELPWSQNHLSFEFKAVDLSHPENVRCRWKMEGAETEWSPLSEQTQVNYANLAPGKYRFLVQATSDETMYSEPVVASFVILKPIWQHWWFQTFGVLFLLALVIGIAYAWVRRVKKAEQTRREKLEVENRVLQLEQKALQLQMNPHFIFNALNSIQSLISTQDYATARQEINGFAKLMRSILSNSRRQFIPLQEEIETLDQYLHIEQFCQQNEFTFAIHIAENIDPESIEIPPMLLQPFVENAVIHGVSHLQYPGAIDLFFALDGDVLTCTILDNGVGREKAALLRVARKPGHQSTAVQVTKERLNAMKGTHKYRALEMEDVLDAAGKIAGTRVIVRLPVELKY